MISMHVHHVMRLYGRIVFGSFVVEAGDHCELGCTFQFDQEGQNAYIRVKKPDLSFLNDVVEVEDNLKSK